MALTDTAVRNQIKHMVAFIHQEALEKVEEIDTKAEEDFNNEKEHLVFQQRVKIMEFYDRKEKRILRQRKINTSTMLNQARLRVLKVREDHVRGVLDEARKRLFEITQDHVKYGKLLEALILQSLYQLFEGQVTVRVRSQDRALVQGLLPVLATKYKDATGKDVRLKIDDETNLPSEIAGGVELYALKGRIKVCNTLEDRLELIACQLLPEIRAALFEQSVNSKFDV